MPSTVGGILLSVLILVGSSFSANPQNRHHRTFEDLYNFTNGADGAYLYGGLARDRRGNLYGVAYTDNDGSGDGTLYQLTPTSQGYAFRVIHDFSADTGRLCMTTPTIDEQGNVFGVCEGGGGSDKGTLWEYSNAGEFTVLQVFNGPGNGMSPQDKVAIDKAGNIYGTAYTWGPGSAGTLWKYSRRTGVLTVLHGFANGDDGGLLPTGPSIDDHGVIWGTTEFGPNCYYCGAGTLWNYDPSSGIFTTVLDFSGTLILAPQSKLAIDHSGNLFGTAFGASGQNCGLVYQLPKGSGYIPVVLYAFTGQNGDGCYPYGRVRFDRFGNLLGTTYSGGDGGFGTVYELQHERSGWHEIILHSFDLNDGADPQSGLATDNRGNWFGTTAEGGPDRAGNVFEISGVP